MSLCEYERHLLTRAREIIIEGEGGWGPRFICCSIDDARRESARDSLYLGRSYIGDELRKKVLAALGGPFTFEEYFYRELGIRPERVLAAGTEDGFDKYGIPKFEIQYLPFKEFYNLTRLARCAWIDRMLETGEVK